MINLYSTNRTFSAFKSAIASLPAVCPEDVPSLFLSGEKDLSEYYIPFDYVESNARFIITGITPGRTQWQNALLEAQRAIQEGAADEDVLRRAKKIGAFSGDLRKGLVEEFDYVGLNRKLGVTSCAEFFNEDNSQVHMTSCFVNPIFKNGKNFNGALRPKSSLLMQSFKEGFLKEAQAIPNAFIVPLGTAASETIKTAVELGLLERDRVLSGFVHPSGANRGRLLYFLGRKSRNEMTGANNPDLIDSAKEELRQTIERICV